MIGSCVSQLPIIELINTRSPQPPRAAGGFLYLNARLRFVYEMRLILRAVELKVDRWENSLIVEGFRLAV